MNYMKQVAQMLGVELEEEFYLKGDNHIYKISTNGLFCLADNKKMIITNLTLALILTGKREIIKKPILDEVEKEYLSNVIKPFRDRVEFIVKRSFPKYEYIEISYREINTFVGAVCLPIFKENTIYKNMKINEEYTLEDLEL